MKRILTGTITMLATAGLILTAGCGGYRGFDEIEENIENPTAPVTNTTVKAAFANNQEQNSGTMSTATGQVSAIPSYAWGTTAKGHALYVPARLRPFLPATMPAALAAQTSMGCEADGLGALAAQDVSVELDMASLPGSTATGTLKYEVSFDDLCNYEIVITMDNICNTVNDACVDGSFGFKMEGESLMPMVGKLLSSGKVTVTGANEELTLEWGLRVTYDESLQSATVEFVTFVDVDGEEKSLVIEAAATAGSGTVTVRGSDGEFTCTYSNDGDEGSCTGSGGNTVTWTAG